MGNASVDMSARARKGQAACFLGLHEKNICEENEWMNKATLASLIEADSAPCLPDRKR